MITVRLFAAAADAAGTETLELERTDVSDAVATAATVGAYRDLLAERFGGELRRVLDRSTFLVNGERVAESHRVTTGDTFDVLPPFAGG